MFAKEMSALGEKFNDMLNITPMPKQDIKSNSNITKVKGKKKSKYKKNSSSKPTGPDPVPLKFEDGSHYKQKNLPLFMMETNVAKKLELSKKLEEISLRWEKELNNRGEEILYAFFTLNDEQKDEMGLENGKWLCLECQGPEKPSWKGVGIVSNLINENSEVEETRVLFGSLEKPQLHYTDNFSMSLLYNDTKTKRVLESIDNFAKGEDDISSKLQHAILGNVVEDKSISNLIPIDFSDVKLPALNVSQMDAVQYSLENNITLIQAPPGTGKTVTSAMIVYAAVKKFKGKVLVCASSNVAVDNLAEKVHLTGLKSIRVYTNSLEENFKSTNFPALHQEVNKILAKNPTFEQSLIENDILEDSEVILCTCIGAGDKRLLGYKFKTVLLDEGTQTTEPECLIPLVKGCQRAIIVGDHKQLGPVVIHKKAASKGLDQSMFERLIKLKFPVIQLKIQFRAHPNLITFPNNEFYGGSLQSGITSQNRVDKTCRFSWPNSDNPSFFYCNLGPDRKQPSGTSFINKSESIKCIDVINHLLKSGVISSQIAVITHYLGQKLFLSRELNRKDKKKYQKIEIASVDAFQGREKDYIIISCVRSNASNKIDFLKDPRRLNVALTRARYSLILIGNLYTLNSDPLWKRLITHYQNAGIIVDGPITNLKPFKFKPIDNTKIPNSKFNSRSKGKSKSQNLKSTKLNLK